MQQYFCDMIACQACHGAAKGRYAKNGLMMALCGQECARDVFDGIRSHRNDDSLLIVSHTSPMGEALSVTPAFATGRTESGDFVVKQRVAAKMAPLLQYVGIEETRRKRLASDRVKETKDDDDVASLEPRKRANLVKNARYVFSMMPLDQVPEDQRGADMRRGSAWGSDVTAAIFRLLDPQEQDAVLDDLVKDFPWLENVATRPDVQRDRLRDSMTLYDACAWYVRTMSASTRSLRLSSLENAFPLVRSASLALVLALDSRVWPDGQSAAQWMAAIQTLYGQVPSAASYALTVSTPSGEKQVVTGSDVKSLVDPTKVVVRYDTVFDRMMAEVLPMPLRNGSVLRARGSSMAFCGLLHRGTQDPSGVGAELYAALARSNWERADALPLFSVLALRASEGTLAPVAPVLLLPLERRFADDPSEFMTDRGVDMLRVDPITGASVAVQCVRLVNMRVFTPDSVSAQVRASPSLALDQVWAEKQHSVVSLALRWAPADLRDLFTSMMARGGNEFERAVVVPLDADGNTVLHRSVGTPEELVGYSQELVSMANASALHTLATVSGATPITLVPNAHGMAPFLHLATVDGIDQMREIVLQAQGNLERLWGALRVDVHGHDAATFLAATRFVGLKDQDRYERLDLLDKMFGYLGTAIDTAASPRMLAFLVRDVKTNKLATQKDKKRVVETLQGFFAAMPAPSAHLALYDGLLVKRILQVSLEAREFAWIDNALSRVVPGYERLIEYGSTRPFGNILHMIVANPAASKERDDAQAMLRLIADRAPSLVSQRDSRGMRPMDYDVARDGARLLPEKEWYSYIERGARRRG